MKRALISVSDKTGVVEFAKSLSNLGWEIISTGGTADTLKKEGIPVIPVSEVTGFPEILEGRVKTLHPGVHGGILARGTEEHYAVLDKHNITPIDIVAVNLYPFVETISKPGVNLEDAIENIDIGGPTMIRSAAKNHERVAVVVSPERYKDIISELEAKKDITKETKRLLAYEAFTHTAEYDAAISSYLGTKFTGEKMRENMIICGHKVQDLRYGENPHQKAVFYKFPGENVGSIAGAKQLNGKELSYNNIVDVEAAWNVVKDYSQPAACVIKHTNPCGTALGTDLADAYAKAFAADSKSAYGGIVGLNKKVDEKTALQIGDTFLEAVIAPEFSPEALEILCQKQNLRLLQIGYEKADNKEMWLEKVSGGFLVQELDEYKVEEKDLAFVTEKKPDAAELEELLFAWNVVKNVKSNAIVLSKNRQTVGVGAGQMNRVGAAKIAFEQAGEKCTGSVMASDAFFPFRDTIDEAAKAGIVAIIQPGGSIRDEESIQACNEHGIAMVFTGIRHFRH